MASMTSCDNKKQIGVQTGAVESNHTKSSVIGVTAQCRTHKAALALGSDKITRFKMIRLASFRIG